MSRHPQWPSVKQVLDMLYFTRTDVDEQKVRVLPMNLPWVQQVVDPGYVPPSEWNLNLPPEWASHPQPQDQEHGSDFGVKSSGIHGDEGLIFGCDKEQDHPVTILPTGVFVHILCIRVILKVAVLPDLPPLPTGPRKTSVSDDPPPPILETRPIRRSATTPPGIPSTTLTGTVDAESSSTDRRSVDESGVGEPPDDQLGHFGGPGAEKNV